MKLFYIIFLFFALIGFGVKAQELVIEVTTDKYPAETLWTLFDTQKNNVKQSGTLEKQTTHRDTVQLDNAKCYYWTIYDSYGDGMSNSEAPGDYKLYIDGELLASCADPNFGDSISVYGIGGNCPAFDGAIDALTFNEVQAFNPFYISFQLQNFGSETINTLEVAYTIDNNDAVTALVEELAVEFGQLNTITLPEAVQIKSAGSHTIKVELTKINGTVDENTQNNIMQKTVQVEDGFWKKPMHEVFTSSTCPPCKQGNEVLDGVLNRYDSTLYSLVKYQVNWPGTGDPYYTAEVGLMKSFYNVSAVPSLYVNNNFMYPHDYTVETFEDNQGVLTQLDIEMNGTVRGDSVFAEVYIESDSSYENVYLRLMVVEKTTYENTATNGETQFHNVFMKFLTDWEGDLLGTVNQGETLNLNFKADLSETFVEEMSDLRLVAYVFNANQYKILQSEMVDMVFVPTAPLISSSIENGSAGVDTMPALMVYTNRLLYNASGVAITNFTNHVQFTNATNRDEQPDYSLNWSDISKKLTVTLNQPLKNNSTYNFKLTELYSKEGLKAENFDLSFTTIVKVDVEDELETIAVYPNPFKEQLFLEMTGPAKISVVDAAGRIVFQEPLVNDALIIETSSWNTGVYFMHLKQQSTSKVVKVVKTN